MVRAEHEAEAALASRATSSVGWLTAQTWIVKIGGFLTVILLARLLTPTDFGLVAVALTVLPLVYLLSDLGFATYLMQADRVDRVVSGTAFWYSTTSAVALGVLMVACAPLIEDLFGVAGVAPVIAAVSPAVVFVGLAAVPVALLRRQLRFRALAIQGAAAAFAGQIAALTLALLGFGVWALVVQVCIVQAVIMVASWISSRWVPSRTFSWRSFRRMAGFGASVLGVNGAGLARNWGENAIISNTLGVAALGQLSVAQRLIQTTQEVAGAAISPVSTVVFSQVREDRPRLRRGYDRALGLSYVLMTPALTAIVVTAPLLVPLLFGPQWSEAIGPTQALAVAAIFTLSSVLDHGLFYGMGRPGTWLVYAIVIDGLTVATTAVVARFGITAVAWGFAAVAVTATVVRWVMVARAIEVSVWSVSRRVAAALVLAAISGLAGWAVLSASSALPPVLGILVAGCVILAVHIALSLLLLRSASRELLIQISSRLRRRRNRA